MQSSPTDIFTQLAILTTWNDTTLTTNNTILLKFRREKQALLFESVDSCDAIDDYHYPVTDEFLKALLPSGFPKLSMNLKLDVFVILLRNINDNEGCTMGQG